MSEETKKPMKVRLTLEVDEFERFVIAKYFAPVTDKKTSRAPRKQVMTFAKGAVRSAVLEHVTILRGRPHATANRLKDGSPKPITEELKKPDESQRPLF